MVDRLAGGETEGQRCGEQAGGGETDWGCHVRATPVVRRMPAVRRQWGNEGVGIRGCREVRHRRSASSSARSPDRSEEHTSELQSLMRISYAVFCLKKKKKKRKAEQKTEKTT